MEKIAQLKHHSLTDWDFQADSLGELDTVYYVSEPKSLAVPKTSTNYWQWIWAYLKASVNNCIPHGLLATYLWMDQAGACSPWFWVRAQALPPAGAGLIKPANGYAFRCTKTLVEMYRRVNNVETKILQQVLANQLPEKQWNRIAMFWETLDLGFGKFLRLTFQVNVGEFWITQATFDDTQNLWEASGVNKVGFNLAGTFYQSNPLNKGRVDDTEIWKRKES